MRYSAVEHGADATSRPGMRLDKLLAAAGLASSASEGQRKIKEGAVKLGGNGENVATDTIIFVDAIPAELIVRVGRKIKKIEITDNL